MKRLLDVLAVAILFVAGATFVGLILSEPQGWAVFAVIGAAAVVLWAILRLDSWSRERM